MNEIVREYGAGLFELAAEENCADELLTEEREIKKLLSREYLHFLIDPSVSKEERKNCVRQAFSGVHPYLLNFMLLMTERGLATEIPGSFGEYEKLYYDRYKIVRATPRQAPFPSRTSRKNALRKSSRRTPDTASKCSTSLIKPSSAVCGLTTETTSSKAA